MVKHQSIYHCSLIWLWKWKRSLRNELSHMCIFYFILFHFIPFLFLFCIYILGFITCSTEPLGWFFAQWPMDLHELIQVFQLCMLVLLPWIQIVTVIWVSTVMNTNISFFCYSKLLLCVHVSSPLLSCDNTLWVKIDFIL